MRHVCSTVAVMYLGRIIEMGPADQVLDQPHHPYAQALVAAVPVMGGRSVRNRTPLTGAVPNPSDLPTGCRFHPRCPKAMARCRESEPALKLVASGHQVACHLYN
jgi:oligopeptide/dipeptide ABC transporter ATP-binding protein